LARFVAWLEQPAKRIVQNGGVIEFESDRKRIGAERRKPIAHARHVLFGCDKLRALLLPQLRQRRVILLGEAARIVERQSRRDLRAASFQQVEKFLGPGDGGEGDDAKPGFFLSVKALARLFRRMFLAALEVAQLRAQFPLLDGAALTDSG